MKAVTMIVVAIVMATGGLSDEGCHQKDDGIQVRVDETGSATANIAATRFTQSSFERKQ